MFIEDQIKGVRFRRDPENQLCTDDLIGYWTHNASLSVEAIIDVAGYNETAHILSLYNVAEKYVGITEKIAVRWEEMVNEDGHYHLASDRENTQSQKYNTIQDKMRNLSLFPNNVIDKEVGHCLTKQDPYGLSLDSRKKYIKSDQIIWTATMSPDWATSEKFINPPYKYINETTSRVPISDWHDTKTSKMTSFKTRSVIGGYWMRVLVNKNSGSL